MKDLSPRDLSNNILKSLIPEAEMRRVFNSDSSADITPDSMCSSHIYLSLSQIIPKSWTVVDLGCSYMPQQYLFKDHRRYIGVDLGTRQIEKRTGWDIQRFTPIDNAEYYEGKISDFIQNTMPGLDLNLQSTMAICAWVPSWHDDNAKLARENFKNVFAFWGNSFE